jgi:hypothetical protein
MDWELSMEGSADLYLKKTVWITGRGGIIRRCPTDARARGTLIADIPLAGGRVVQSK